MRMRIACERRNQKRSLHHIIAYRERKAYQKVLKILFEYRIFILFIMSSLNININFFNFNPTSTMYYFCPVIIVQIVIKLCQNIAIYVL